MTLDNRKYKTLEFVFTYQIILKVYILIYKALNYTEEKDIANYDSGNTSVWNLRQRIIKKNRIIQHYLYIKNTESLIKSIFRDKWDYYDHHFPFKL